MLGDTVGAEFPFWSPDSRFVGFFVPHQYSSNKLKKIEIPNGSPEVICPVVSAHGGTWNADGTILFSAKSTGGAVYRVSASGGDPAPVTVLDKSSGEVWHSWPHFLPDGRHFLYLVVTGSPETTGIRAGSLDADGGRGNDKLLAVAASNAVYAPPPRHAGFQTGPGRLLFMRDGVLLAQPFDAGRLLLQGNAATVSRSVEYRRGIKFGSFSASANGNLAYAAPREARRRMVWRDRDGQKLEFLGPPAFLDSPAISPDGTRVAYSRREESYTNWNIWQVNVESSRNESLTVLPDDESSPVWLTNDTQLAFNAGSHAYSDVYRRPIPGGARPERLTSGKSLSYINDWSGDGRFVLLSVTDAGTDARESKVDLMVVPMDGGDRTPVPWLQTSLSERQGRFSPNGSGPPRWIAYVSGSGAQASDVFVQAFTPGKPAAGVRYQISQNGGESPRWRGDGKELFYLSRDLKIMAVSVTDRGSSLELGVPRVLFQANIRWGLDLSVGITT